MDPGTPYNLRMPPGERRTIFREMAKGELRRGPMSPARQRGLVAYAARLGIHPTEAVQLLQEAARESGMPVAVPAAAMPEPTVADGSLSPRLWLTVSLLAVVAAASQLILRYRW